MPPPRSPEEFAQMADRVSRQTGVPLEEVVSALQAELAAPSRPSFRERFRETALTIRRRLAAELPPIRLLPGLPPMTLPSPIPRKFLATALTPETPEALVRDVALMATGFGPLAKVPALAGAALRIGAPTLAAGGTAAVTGGEPGKAAGEALLLAGGGEALRLGGEQVLRGGRAISQLVRRQRIASVKDAADLGRTINETVEAFPTLRTSEDLLRLRDRRVGLHALGQSFDRMEAAVTQALGGANREISAPTLASASPQAQRRLAAIMNQLGLTDPSQIPPQMRPQLDQLPISEAFGLLKVLKARGRKAPVDVLGRPAREVARAAERELRDAITDPALVELYDKTVAEYGRGIGILELLEESKVVGSAAEGARTTLQALQNFLVENIENFSPTVFPKLWQAAARGAPIGSADVPPAAIRVFLPGLSRMLPGGAVNIPLLPSRFVGRSPVPPVPTPFLPSGAMTLPLATTFGREGESPP